MIKLNPHGLYGVQGRDPAVVDTTSQLLLLCVKCDGWKDPAEDSVFQMVLSRVRLFGTPRTVAHQAPLPMGFSRQEHWSGSPCPPPGDLPDPGIEPVPPALAGRFFTTELSGKPQCDKLRKSESGKSWGRGQGSGRGSDGQVPSTTSAGPELFTPSPPASSFLDAQLWDFSLGWAGPIPSFS